MGRASGRARIAVFLLLPLVALAAAGPGDDASYFVEITASAGLDFVHDPGATGAFHLPEITGAGGGLFDYDGDGDLDVYLVQSGPLPDGRPPARAGQNRLYRLEADGRLTDATEASGLGDAGYGMGVAVGDIDDDGDVDVFVTNYGPDRLYRNEGGGRFVDVTERAGIGAEPAWSASAAFCDYDADGDLDLYVARYVRYEPEKRCTRTDGRPDYCSPQVFAGTPDVLYRNEGGGRFEDVSAAAGLRAVAAPGLGVVCADLTGDGRLDFYVANDGEANQLWVNRGGGRFEDEAILAGLALNGMGQPEAGMGVALGDVDGDADLDLFVTHLVDETNTLYANEGALGFEDRSDAAGLGAPSLPRTGFGTGFFDVELDGDLDLAVVNGRVRRGAPVEGVRLGPPWSWFAEPNQLFVNDGRGRFTDASARAGPFSRHIEVSRGLALGDLDDDGDVDLLVTNTAGPARLFRNEAPRRGHWLVVRAFDPERRRDAHGARITVLTTAGPFVRWASPAYGFLATNDPRAHFGLPRGARVEAIEVVWPDGTAERFAESGVDRLVVVEKGRGRTP